MELSFLSNASTIFSTAPSKKKLVDNLKKTELNLRRLYLSGHKIVGKLICSQGGHKLTNQLLRKIFSDNQNFSIFELKEKNIPHSFINKTALKSIA